MLNINDRINPSGANSLDYRYSPATGGAWESTEAFLAAMQAKFITVPCYTTILCKDANGNSVEMWNPESATEFTPKTVDSGAVYKISASEWSLTQGLLPQTADKHYTDAQYDAMRQNAIQLNAAINYAYTQGYSTCILEKGVYCFCLSMPENKDLDIPQVHLLDLNNFTIDLGGSTLKLCSDDTQFGKYYLNRPTVTETAGSPMWQHGMILAITYCKHLTIQNGIMRGDRFDRTYDHTLFPVMQRPSLNENTHGIEIHSGCEYITIRNVEFREFMGDGIMGYGAIYHTGKNIVELESEGVNEQMGCKESEKSYKAKYIYYVDGALQEDTKGKVSATMTDFIDTTALYADAATCGIANRLADSQFRQFQVGFKPGAMRLPSCYVPGMYLLTYTEIDGVKTLARRIPLSALSRFELSSGEKYVRFMFTNETEVVDEHSSTKTYAAGDLVCHKEDSLTCTYRAFKACKGVAPNAQKNGYPTAWELISVEGPNVTTTYDSTKQYITGDTCTYALSNTYARYSCKTAGTTGAWDSTLWNLVKTEKPALAYSEYGGVRLYEATSSDILIEDCKFINMHRGGVSNLPHRSVVSRCSFVKHIKSPNDGFPAPNFGNYLDGTYANDTTVYHMDLEDWYSSSVKVLNCRFESAYDDCEKILVNCFDFEFAGNTGFASLHLNSTMHANIHDNGMDRFDLGQNYGFLPMYSNSPERYMTMDVDIHNNRFIAWKTAALGHGDGRRFSMSNNIIYEEFISGDNAKDAMNDYSSDLFTNNTFHGKYQLNRDDSVTMPLGGRSVDGTSIDVLNASINIFSPAVGRATVSCKNPRFCESPNSARIYKGLDVTANGGNMIILTRAQTSGTTGSVEISDCTLDFGKGMQISGNNRYTLPATCSITFRNCRIKKSTSGIIIANSGLLDGDAITLNFIDCDFDVNDTRLTNDTKFIKGAFRRCTANKALTFNGETLPLDA